MFNREKTVVPQGQQQEKSPEVLKEQQQRQQHQQTPDESPYVQAVRKADPGAIQGGFVIQGQGD